MGRLSTQLHGKEEEQHPGGGEVQPPGGGEDHPPTEPCQWIWLGTRHLVGTRRPGCSEGFPADIQICLSQFDFVRSLVAEPVLGDHPAKLLSKMASSQRGDPFRIRLHHDIFCYAALSESGSRWICPQMVVGVHFDDLHHIPDDGWMRWQAGKGNQVWITSWRTVRSWR